MAGQLKTRRSPQCATARRLSPHHKHIVPVARDLEVLAGEDTSTTIDSVDGDIPIMRIQLLTGVSLLLLLPIRSARCGAPDARFPPPAASCRVIAMATMRSSGATSAGRSLSPGGHEATERGDDKTLVC
jgi:hypothetical protein